MVIEAGEQPRGEPCRMKSWPESIAWSTEVVTDGCRVETRVDSAEHDIEARLQKITKSLRPGSSLLSLIRFPQQHSEPVLHVEHSQQGETPRTIAQDLHPGGAR